MKTVAKDGLRFYVHHLGKFAGKEWLPNKQPSAAFADLEDAKSFMENDETKTNYWVLIDYQDHTAFCYKTSSGLIVAADYIGYPHFDFSKVDQL